MHKIYTLVVFLFGFVLHQHAQDKIFSFDSTAVPEVSLEEIIIEASRDQSELKELPIAVSLISADLANANEIRTLDEVSLITPNFYMPDYGSRLTSPVYIRGIGSRINSPSVGLYVDNIPYFEKAAFNFDFFDIERIEILKGPQGTLYGRNSMGGLINIITKSPLREQGNHVMLSGATYGNYRLNAGHYSKPTEKFAFSLSGSYQHHDGFYNNAYLDQRVDELDSYGLRNKLIYQFSDNLTIENIATFDQSSEGGYPYAVYNDSIQQAEQINYNQPSSYYRFIFSDGLKLNYSTSKWELQNTLSYQLLDDVQEIDQDFTQDSLYFVEQAMARNMFSGELTIRSKNNKRFKWLFGAFGFMQFFDKSVDVDIYPRNMWYIKNYLLDVSGFALFHQSTLQLTPAVSVTAGIRYDQEISSLDYAYYMESAGMELKNIDTTYTKLEDNVLLPKFAVNYRFHKSSIYASYTTGYKPGGFNSTFEKARHLKFKHEKSYNFETGFKSRLLNGLFHTDLAVFYTKLNNQQIYRTVPSGRGAYLDNAGLSENMGFEVSLKSRSINGFEGNISYGFTHSKILEYVKDSATNYNNNYTPYIPRQMFTVQGTKAFRLRNGSFVDYITLNATYHRHGTTYWTLENNYAEEPYHLLNAKVSFTRKNIKFDLWARNILDQSYRSFLFEAMGSTFVQMNKPFQLGANLSVNF
jgi:outer membrane receptor protein involved in Fe transport